MGNVVHHVIEEIPLSGGQKMLTGKLNMSTSYAAAGDALNLSNYLKSASSPTVIVGGEQNASNIAVLCSHDSGTAAAGKIRIYLGGTAEDEFEEANATLDFSGVNIPFVAVGQAF